MVKEPSHTVLLHVYKYIPSVMMGIFLGCDCCLAIELTNSAACMCKKNIIIHFIIMFIVSRSFFSQQIFKGGGHSYCSDEVFKIMRLFQAFTNNSEAFKDQFCPKKQAKKSIKKESGTILKRGGNKIGGWVPEIGGCPAPFPTSAKSLNLFAYHCNSRRPRMNTEYKAFIREKFKSNYPWYTSVWLWPSVITKNSFPSFVPKFPMHAK